MKIELISSVWTLETNTDDLLNFIDLHTYSASHGEQILFWEEGLIRLQ
jgi:hypothetical protein